MLLVNARRGRSPIHGDGLIAQELIPAGTRVWELHPWFDVVLTEAQFQALSPAARQQVLHYCYFDPRNNTYVLSSDDDRFTNHSDTPNTSEDVDGTSSVALRDIQPGEEITWNYRNWGGVRFEMTAAKARTGAAE